MKFLFLVILMSQTFSGTFRMPVYQAVVPSVEFAAVKLWDYQQSVTYPEPEQYEAFLFEIDLEMKTVKEIPIPDIEFKHLKKEKK